MCNNFSLRLNPTRFLLKLIPNNTSGAELLQHFRSLGRHIGNSLNPAGQESLGQQSIGNPQIRLCRPFKIRLTRTATRLDHSQKAEKVCRAVRCRFNAWRFKSPATNLRPPRERSVGTILHQTCALHLSITSILITEQVYIDASPPRQSSQANPCSQGPVDL